MYAAKQTSKLLPESNSHTPVPNFEPSWPPDYENCRFIGKSGNWIIWFLRQTVFNQCKDYPSCLFAIADLPATLQNKGTGPIKTIYMPDSSYMQVRQANGNVLTGSYHASTFGESHNNGDERQSNSPRSVTFSSAIAREQVYASLVSLGCVAMPATMMTLLSTYLMVTLQGKSNGSVYETVFCSVAMAFTSFTLAFSTSAMFTSLLQLFFCLKTLKLTPDSHIKIMRYLRQGMYLRLASFVGFFISIPVFLVAVILTSYTFELSIYDSSVTSAVYTVICAVGVLLCLLTLAHSVYAWLWGVLKLPEFGFQDGDEKLVIDKNFSTLV